MIQLPITLEQLITTVRQLQPSDRGQVAKALIYTELKSDLTNLPKSRRKAPCFSYGDIRRVSVANK
jgi:hypothetical protein